MKRNGLANLFLGFIFGFGFNGFISDVESKGEVFGASLMFLLLAWVFVAFLYGECDV